MRLLFVRHGDPDYENDCLTPLGVREAEAAADALEHVGIDAFFQSPLGRAMETAEATLRRKGKKAEVCDWLREFHAPIHRPDRQGEWEIPWDWLPQDWTAEEAFYDPHGWYKVPVMQEGRVKEEFDRVGRGLDEILSRYGYEREGHIYRVREPNTKCLCFFCHYGVGIVMLSHLMSVSPMPLWHGLMAAPASITELCTEERREGIASFRLNRYGDVSHIAKAGLPVNVNGRFAEVYSDFEQRHD